MYKQILLIIAFIITIGINAQSKQDYYIIEKVNHSANPTDKSVNADGTLALTFNNTELQTFFQNKNVYQYYQPYISADNEYLQRVHLVTMDDDSHYDELLSLNNVENVEIIEEPTLLYEPNDYNGVNNTPNRSLELIHATEAWDITTGDPDVLVGINDTYFETTHDELINQIIANYDTYPDENFHGTMVAGNVAAQTDNNIGVSAIGFNTKLITNANGLSTANVWNMFELHPDIKVINCSWIYCSYNPTDALVYEELYNSGVTVVCGAGNGSMGASCGGGHGYGYPASYEHTISVSSVGHKHDIGYVNPNTGMLHNWKDVHVPVIGNPETCHTHNDKVDICAPGHGVSGITINNGYSSGWGTSFASPMVAGTCALMYAVNPDITAEEVREKLLSSADDIYYIPENEPYIGLLGTGRLNAYRAVKEVDCMVNPDTQLDLHLIDQIDDNAINIVWNTQDIWVRNQPDGINIHEHQNPEYDPNTPRYVYVRVRNKSCITPMSGKDVLKLYWAKANTALTWPQHWDGSLFVYNNDLSEEIVMGSPIAELTIPPLEAGQETILQFEWNMPDPNDYQGINPNPWQFSLLARIVSNDDPMEVPETSNLWANVYNNNNIALKNTTIVDFANEIPNDKEKIGGVVAVGNPYNETRTFKLELVKDETENGKAIYDEAEIGIKMDDILFNAWEIGGKTGSNLKATNEEQKQIATNNNVLLDNIQLEPNEIGTLYLSFNFLTKELTDKDNFTYHIIQRDALTNEIIGGETFEIRKKSTDIFIADAGNDKEIEQYQTVTISAQDINEAAIYNWYDADGNLIYTGKDLTVSPDVTKKYKLEIITDKDGYKDYDEIEVKVKPFSLQSLTPNPASDQVSVAYKAFDASSAYLMLINTVDGSSNNYILDINANEISINISNYSQGIYSISLVCDGEIVDAKNLIIE